MTNEQILENRWKYTNLRLNTYLKTYRKLNLRTQDKIQDIFDSISYEFLDLNKPITKIQRDKFLRKVEEWKESNILKGYLEYRVNYLLSKRQITNDELLDILLLGIFVEERNNLSKQEQNLFLDIGTNLYEQGIDEIKPSKAKKLSITWEFIYSLLCLPNSKGIKWDIFIESLMLTNSQEIKRMVINCMQQNKELNINDKVFQDTLRKQQNRYLSIKDDKISGSLDLQVREIANQSFLKAGNDTGVEKCRFVSDLCFGVTKMCLNLNNCIFNINEDNIFDRYMGESARELRWTRMKVKGLQLGINLPPIIHHYHYCHSTITYLIDLPVEVVRKTIIKEFTDISKEMMKRVGSNSGKVEEQLFFEYKGKQYKVDGKNVVLDYSNKEKEVAEWLTATFGGEIKMLPRINNPKGIETPDYIWNGDYWDLKSMSEKAVSEIRAVDNVIKSAKDQTTNIILDITKTKLSNENIIEQVQKIFSTSGREWVDRIMIIDNYKLIKIYQRGK